MGLIAKAAARAAGKKLNRAAGHDTTVQPGGYLLHYSTCRCGMGVRALVTRKDWADLDAHPLPDRKKR